MGPLRMRSFPKPLFSYQVVAKRRKDRSDKAREGHPLAGRATRSERSIAPMQ